ncbi:MAG: AraC family transcriptional regulator [Eubacteriales bacterium]|nr:helix-turn-helix transcriptional regulator [Clostridiales bacterium]
MYWVKEMQNTIAFIEGRITEDISIEEISCSANTSSANFKRIFSIVAGVTVGDYIRYRRLSLAAKDLIETNYKIIDIAIKYGYETAESFTKAFTRFHNATLSAVRRKKSTPKTFEPLLINIDIRGGFVMRRKLIPNIPELQ